MILVFKTEKDATACEAQIFQYIQRKYIEDGYKVVDGSIVIKDGKQGIDRWAYPIKAKTGLLKPSKWYFKSPKSSYPDLYEDMVKGFKFEEIEELPVEWQEKI